MQLSTHKAINQTLCGRLLSNGEGSATVKLSSTPEMVADDHGLVHGGFVFGAADFAAMAAVNDSNVVLGSANVKFLKPLKMGGSVTLEAKITETDGKRRLVDVTGVDETGAKAFSGVFTCFVLEKHVLES